MIFGIHCNTFFKQTSNSSNVPKFSSINFNYTYRLHFVLVSRTYFDKNLIYPEIQAARILIKLKSSWQISSTPPCPLQLGTKNTGILILNVMVKNLCNLSNEKNSTLLSWIARVLRKWWRVAGDRDLTKWNRGNMPLT